MSERPELNIELSPQAHKLESSECLLLSHGAVTKVFELV